MKHYKVNNEIRAIEQGQEFLVQADWIELSDEELHGLLNPPKTEEQINAQKVQEARNYLTSTAWYVERFNDPSSGKPIPQEVLDKRAEARLIINELEG